MPDVNVLGEILRWSSELPSWQRDALRRLLVNGELKEGDYIQLADQCKWAYGLAARNVASEPLGAAHIPSPATAENAVILRTITHRSGVNALAPEQTIEVGAQLTVVYGDNAAGKSGFTRILKRACHARGAEEILGNVVAGTAPGRPSAAIKFEVGDQKHEFVWDDDKPADRYLARVSVFDRHCASVYIAEETDVAFRPLGLDLFDKLAVACEAVRRILEKERRELEAAAIALPQVQSGTAVFEVLSRLSSLTKPETIKELAALSPEEQSTAVQLKNRLRELQSDDPRKAAMALDLRAKRLEMLRERIANATGVLNNTAMRAAFEAVTLRRRAADEAEVMRREVFDAQPVPHTGSEAWRDLWAAAGRFSSTDAYPEENFPFTATGARCVLCQQKLTDEAVARFKAFETFVESKVQRNREETATVSARLRKQLSDLLLKDTAATAAVEEVSLDNATLAEAISTFIDECENRRIAALNTLAEEGELPPSLAIPLPPVAGLQQYLESLRSRANELRGEDRSAAIAGIIAPLRELESRQSLGHHLDSVLAEIERKKRVAAYVHCIEETRTNSITRKSSEITKLAVTEQLAKSFKEELGQLRFRHVEVELVATGGSRGSLYHKLQLRRAPGVSVPRVVSEGEARCLSIASFFAELSTTADRSPILFDDPVSSLDHNWRDRVAARLVAEAKSRQVVVFTHDIVFLMGLVEHAESNGTNVTQYTLRRGGTAAGLATQGAPYRAMKVQQRIGYLKNAWQIAEKLHRDNKPQDYEIAGTRIYALLRQAWERAVEELLIYGVVERYRNSVETNRARHLKDITETDCDALTAGMTKCSKWEGGHDHAAGENAPFPEPAEIKLDIDALEKWAEELKKRRK